MADDGAEPRDEGSRILLFQSVRELLFNVIKHSEVDAPSGSFGLFSIRERLSHMGGTMRIKSAPGKGTREIL